MANCPYCDTPIIEEFNFCVNCEQQVKCLQCNGFLVKEKSRCLLCGATIGKFTQLEPKMNTFSLEEDQTDNSYHRSISLAFSDNAIDKVAPALTGYVPFAKPKNGSSDFQNRRPVPPALPFGKDVTSQVSEIEPETDGEEQSASENISGSDHNNIPHDAKNYFEHDKEKGFLISKQRDFRGKSKKVQQERFILLYIWAYQPIVGSSISDNKHISQAASANHIHDRNFVTYMGKMLKAFTINVDGTYKLNPDGENNVKKILAEMQKTDTKGFDYIATPVKGGTKARLNAKDIQLIEQWVKKTTRLSSFDVRTLGESPVHLTILAIFDITKEIGEMQAVKPGVAYAYLVKRYTTVPISNKQLTHSLSNNKKFFSRTDSGGYYLTAEAEAIAESWIKQSKGKA